MRNGFSILGYLRDEIGILLNFQHSRNRLEHLHGCKNLGEFCYSHDIAIIFGYGDLRDDGVDRFIIFDKLFKCFYLDFLALSYNIDYLVFADRKVVGIKSR